MSEVKPAPSNLSPEEMIAYMEHHYPDMDGNWRRVLDMLEVAIEQGLDMRFGMNYHYMSDKEKHKNSIVT